MDEVSEDDVLLLITRTQSKDYESFLTIVKQYYEDVGGPHAAQKIMILQLSRGRSRSTC